MSKYIITILIIMGQAVIMSSIGYGLKTWQYWAILIGTCIYGFLEQL